MSRLDGKIAIVTGSASGIGRQIAFRFAREGAKVAVADLDLGRAQEVASEITLGGGIATAVEMDVADEAQVKAGVDEVATRFGGVDILVSNAGIQHIAPLVDLSLADWRKMMAVHLDGAFVATQACLRHMIRQGR